MGVTNTTTVLDVSDHERGVAWYSDLFGGKPSGNTVAFAQTLTGGDR